jgi:DNA helicase-2/ATP-dependent DNA helicase PcrA
MQSIGVMNNNKLIIAAAGSGKTTYLINEAIKLQPEKVLITTYTEENEQEIRLKFIEKCKCIPRNVTIQTWFSFLIQHGVKPYQGILNEIMYQRSVNGLILVNKRSGLRYKTDRFSVYWKEEEAFEKHYFNSDMKIFSDKLAKFVYKADEKSEGKVFNRISRMFSHIFIDEVQDLAGYDLELIKKMFRSTSSVILVGDPRQVTYLTHHEQKFEKYKDGKIKDFLIYECKRPIKYTIDDTTLNNSHRNNKEICEFSSKLYSGINFQPVSPCSCIVCRNKITEHEGVYIVNSADVDSYLKRFSPVQLRWSITTNTNPNFLTLNMGQSKGKTFERVLIYPTKEMTKWVKDNNTKLESSTRAKFYVAITRAKHSVGIIADISENLEIEGVNFYSQLET